MTTTAMAPAFRVGKASLGLARDVDLAGPFGHDRRRARLGQFHPRAACAREYGGQHPLGAMAFLRFRID